MLHSINSMHDLLSNQEPSRNKVKRTGSVLSSISGLGRLNEKMKTRNLKGEEVEVPDFYVELEKIIKEEQQGMEETQKLAGKKKIRSDTIGEVEIRRTAIERKHERLFEEINQGRLGAISRTWKLDATNGFLSKTKMEYELNQKMVRDVKAITKMRTKDSTREEIIRPKTVSLGMGDLDEIKITTEDNLSNRGDEDEDEEEKIYMYVKFPVCRTKTGYFKCRATTSDSEIADELGLGLTIFFKQLKWLSFFLIVCTILSIPSYILFWSGNIDQESSLSES